MTDTPPQKPEKVPESPTTARPLDFDDDNQESGVVSVESSTPLTTGNESTDATRSDSRVRFAEQDEEEAPPKPPRPTDPLAEAQTTLLEAFPAIDPKVVKAVLVASGGQVEPAFNALLSMSDPSFAEETPPPQPPRKTATAAQRQLEQDELYARQLAEHYGSSQGVHDPRLQYNPPPRQDSRGYGQRTGPNYQGQRGSGRRGQGEDHQDEKDYNFFDDELPQIRENIKQGFLQTQSKVNKWISDFSKRIDGDDDDDMPAGRQQSSTQPRQNFGASQADQLRGIRQNADAMRARRSNDYDRYDADPQVLNDSFDGLEMRDDEDDAHPPPKPARPTANPNLFKPTPTPPQAGPVDEVDAALYSRPSSTPGSNFGSSQNQSSTSPMAGKGKKWQPLTSVAPAPDAEDNDPFALGDSDDDNFATKKVDLRAEDTERLKAQAANREGGDDSADGKVLTEAETSSGGIRNKEAEKLLSKDS